MASLKPSAWTAAPNLRTGRLAANLNYARVRYQEGGSRLVLRRGREKARRLALGRVGAKLTATTKWLGVYEVMRARFEPEWYAAFYGLHAGGPYRDPFEHYVAIGARHGFSPSARFDEIAYRAAHPDVAAQIARGTVLSGYLHSLLRGSGATDQSFPMSAAATDSVAAPMNGPLATTVRTEFDADWYVDTYPDVAQLIAAGAVPSPLWHYVTEGARAGRAPNAWFDEQWYLQTYLDVANAKTSDDLPNGFFHFLTCGRAEGRQPNPTAPTSLRGTWTGLTSPVGIDRLAALEAMLTPMNYRVYPATGTRRANFMVPTLDDTLVFGGYIAALNFLKQLLDRGWHVRLLILDDVNATADRLRKRFAQDRLGASVVDRAEIINLARRSQILDISPDDSFIAYSMWAAHHAHILASAVGRRFMFFLQEFEPAFHLHDSMHALGTAMYQKPHFALFNSELLRRYFMAERLGVFAVDEEYGRRNSTVFEHALSIPRPPLAGELVRDGTRRLLFYARPEAHAGRNLFEIGVAALRRAVHQGVFADGEWSFDGVGTLATKASINLGRRNFLTIKPRLALGDYAEALRGFEVGLSLQYSPHPGVVHFEMASSGMIVVTNTFSNRLPADLLAISSNIVPVEPTPESIAYGLAESAARSRDVVACARGASGAWVTSWNQSFNDDVMSAVEAELS